MSTPYEQYTRALTHSCFYYFVLYENIDQILPNKLHGPMHYKIGITCVYNGHVFYTLFVITCQSNPPISQFNSPCNDSRMSGQCMYTIKNTKH